MKLYRDLFFAAGRPFSPFYSWLMLARQELYKKGFFKQHRLPVPVISVGNLTMGGTGKTPTVAFIATFLQSLGYRPAIISRGYGGKAKRGVNLVSDGKKVFLDAQQAGDEPAMLARNLPGIPVLTGTKRLYPCFYALEKLHCDILILDDGFQHLSLVRDIDLVLFNATSLAGNSRVFPGGDLREPISALRRSTAFLLTGVDADNQERATRFSKLLQERFPEKSVFSSRFAMGSLLECGEIMQKVSAPPPSPLHAFCGIAQPERFRATLEGAGFILAGFTAFSDHWPYKQDDMDTLSRNAEKNGAKGFVTTEKDLVKVETFTRRLPLFSVKTQLNPEESFPAFLKMNLP